MKLQSQTISVEVRQKIVEKLNNMDLSSMHKSNMIIQLEVAEQLCSITINGHTVYCPRTINNVANAMVQAMPQKCNKCNGTGKVPYLIDNGMCYDCLGTGKQK